MLKVVLPQIVCLAFSLYFVVVRLFKLCLRSVHEFAFSRAQGGKLLMWFKQR